MSNDNLVIGQFYENITDERHEFLHLVLYEDGCGFIEDCSASGIREFEKLETLARRYSIVHSIPYKTLVGEIRRRLFIEHQIQLEAFVEDEKNLSFMWRRITTSELIEQLLEKEDGSSAD